MWDANARVNGGLDNDPYYDFALYCKKLKPSWFNDFIELSNF